MRSVSTTQKEHICKEALADMPSQAHTPESRCSLEPLNMATTTTRILILWVLGKNTPQHSQEINSNQIKPVKQPLLLEGLPTAKATLVQYKAKPGLSGIFHLQKGQLSCPQSLPDARMLEGSPLRPFDYLGSLLR